MNAIQHLSDSNPFLNQIKLLHHLDRLSEWQQTGQTRPVLLEINLSSVCNQACRWCISSFSHVSNPAMSKAEKEAKKSSGCSSKWIDVQHLERFVDEAQAFGVKAVNWSGGGEPTVHPQFTDIALFTSGKLEQGLMTNGQFPKKYVSIIGENMRWVRISLDTFDAEKYHYHRYSSQFCQILENIRLLTYHSAEVGLNMNIAEFNMDEIVDFARRSRDLGVAYVQFRPILGLPFELREDAPYKNQLGQSLLPKIKEALQQAKTYETDTFKVHISWDKFQDIENVEGNYGRFYKACEGHHFVCVVDANGEMDVCMYHLGEKAFRLGNIYEKSLPDIWASAERAATIKHCRESIDFDKCQVCCKQHVINQFLHQLAQPIQNVNFL